ncbi:MAG: monofunctional biosynthetic peptidoglycan transglycosylase [Yoonia sp.]|jgi:monofunctional biosynthetic peptidoglycan transglycosylase|nr:monofunctional biosynthetic peptidoglycan transglycosylase [Yoonia sp.]
MAKATKPKKKTPKTKVNFQRPRPVRFVMRWLLRGFAICVGIAVVLTLLFAVINPPTSIYMLSERSRLGPLDRDWVPIEDIASVMARSAVAAEDANFCLHWGLDLKAIEAALDAGANRGASTISQQVIKNVFLWHGRSWVRKSAEALWTPLSEIIWTKRRILELYLNVAEFDTGVFGVQAAARKYFGVDASDLSALQAARLAAVLPDPKNRDAANPTSYLRRRTSSIMDGAATIAADGRAGCFTD